jgi:hypothetical protein
MTEDSQQKTGAARSGDRRGGDRRSADRRNADRRTPPPPWRRPWALVGYGVLGALAAVLLVNSWGDDPEEAATGGVITTEPLPPAVEAPTLTTGNAPPQEARTAADYERLIAEGQTALGRRVRVELYCDQIKSVAIRTSVDRVEGPVAALADSSSRVPAAECKWGQGGGDVRREDFLLLVPPALAEQFVSAAVVEDGFVSRRRIRGVVEWIGRSQALSLRTAGVLRAFGA